MIGKKVPNKHRSASKRTRIRRLLDYIRNPENENGKEKCLYSGGRGFLTTEAHTRTAEMIALAQDAVRSKDPINHYILSWRQGEQPTKTQAYDAVDIFVSEMGLEGHQLAFAMHADTDNRHLHLVVNRVHPDTGAVVKINKGFDKECLHKVVAKIEHAQGWQREVGGRYKVNEVGAVERSGVETAPQPGAEKRDREIRYGAKSAERIAQEKAGPLLKSARNWPELHAGLEALGMRYERVGSGAIIWVGDVAIKASKANPAGSFTKLQKRLGPFESHDRVKPNEYYTHRPTEPHLGSPKIITQNRLRNMSECRLATDGGKVCPGVLQIDARASGYPSDPLRRPAPRDLTTAVPLEPLVPAPGWTQYTEGRQRQANERKAAMEGLKAKHSRDLRALMHKQREFRSFALAGPWTGRGLLRAALQMVIAAVQRGNRTGLKREQTAELKTLREQYKPWPTYAQWSREQQPAPEPAKSEPPSPPLESREVPKLEKPFVGFCPGYTAGSDAIPVELPDLSNEAVVLAALRSAKKQWLDFRVHGPEEFKYFCVRVAVKHNLPECFENLDLCNVWEDEVRTKWVADTTLRSRIMMGLEPAPEPAKSEPGFIGLTGSFGGVLQRFLTAHPFKGVHVGDECHYHRKTNGQLSFVDRGDSVKILDFDDPATLGAAMRLAIEKWGSFTLHGPVQFKEFCVQVAVEYHLPNCIKNPECAAFLQSELNAKYGHAQQTPLPASVPPEPQPLPPTPLPIAAPEPPSAPEPLPPPQIPPAKPWTPTAWETDDHEHQR